MQIKNLKLDKVHADILAVLVINGITEEQYLPTSQKNTIALGQLATCGMLVSIVHQGKAGYRAATAYGQAALIDFHKARDLDEVIAIVQPTQVQYCPEMDSTELCALRKRIAEAAATEDSPVLNSLKSVLDFSARMAQVRNVLAIDPELAAQMSDFGAREPSLAMEAASANYRDGLSEEQQIKMARSTDGIAKLDLANCSDTVRATAAVTKSQGVRVFGPTTICSPDSPLAKAHATATARGLTSCTTHYDDPAFVRASASDTATAQALRELGHSEEAIAATIKKED